MTDFFGFLNKKKRNHTMTSVDYEHIFNCVWAYWTYQEYTHPGWDHQHRLNNVKAHAMAFHISIDNASAAVKQGEKYYAQGYRVCFTDTYAYTYEDPNGPEVPPVALYVKIISDGTWGGDTNYYKKYYLCNGCKQKRVKMRYWDDVVYMSDQPPHEGHKEQS